MTPAEFLQWEKKASGIDFKLEYVDIAGGDFPAGVLLSQILYWCLPSKSGKSKLTIQREGYLWIAKKKRDWYHETRLTRHKFNHATGVLVDKSLIYVRTFHFKDRPAIHITLRLENFLLAMDEVLAFTGE